MRSSDSHKIRLKPVMAITHPIGFTRPDGSVHIGDDIWIIGNTHNKIAGSKSPASFVEALLLEKALGKVKTQFADGSISPAEILDCLDLEQHIDYYEFWLENNYEPTLENLEIDEYDRAVEMDKFKEYAETARFNLYSTCDNYGDDEMFNHFDSIYFQ